VQDVAAWLTAHQQQQQQQSQQQQPMVQHPRFARVNTLKASVQQVLAQLRNSNGSSSRFEGVKVDDLLPDLLVFPAGTDLHDHPLVTEGVLILQVGN
jgi:putative methyltransferase